MYFNTLSHNAVIKRKNLTESEVCMIFYNKKKKSVNVYMDGFSEKVVESIFSFFRIIRWFCVEFHTVLINGIVIAAHMAFRFNKLVIISTRNSSEIHLEKYSFFFFFSFAEK